MQVYVCQARHCLVIFLLIRVLRERIEMTGLLPWLIIFNLKPDQVPHFVLSDADKRQWMVRLRIQIDLTFGLRAKYCAFIPNRRLQEMSNGLLQAEFYSFYLGMRGSACKTCSLICPSRSAQTKWEMVKQMKKGEAGILADRSVHMLISLLCLFDR